MFTAVNINELNFGLEESTYTAVRNVNCTVKSSAVPKVTQSRNSNCTNLRIIQHTLDLTAQFLTLYRPVLHSGNIQF